MTMPAGEYYVGDLCYVMHDCWDEFCDLMFPYSGDNAHRYVEGEMVVNGRKVCYFSTAYGDGVYLDQFGNKYMVDAGLIGCIAFDDIHSDEIGNVDLGHVRTFTRDFSCYNMDGVLYFGDVIIDTVGEEGYSF